MGKDVFHEIKSRTDIKTIFRFFGISVNAHNMAFCPFHANGIERTPSLKLYEETNTFHCFSCGITGDGISLVSQLFGLSSIDAAHRISDDFNLALFEKELSKADRRRHAKQIQEREELRELAEDFEAWENDFFDFLLDEIWRYGLIKQLTAPRYPCDEWKQDLYIEAINELPVLEFCRDIILFGDIEARIELYLRNREDLAI